MTNNWEVLLKRDNGFNRTVIIEDCMYESEAAEVAESMYGMEVLRVLWKGKTDTSTEDNVNWFVQRRPNYQGLMGLCLTLPLLMGIIVVAESSPSNGTLYAPNPQGTWFTNVLACV